MIKIYKPNKIMVIFRAMNKCARSIVNLLTRLILAFAYYILFFPFAICILIFSDLLNIRNYHNHPRWDKCHEVKDKNNFMRQQ